MPPRGTRPTSDRAREGLFNTLASEMDLAGSRVLDLYAGSGAVGLEALSRGAASAVFVESDRSAAAVIAENVRKLGLPGAVIHRCSVETYLAATGVDLPFDLVFADPPYALETGAVTALLGRLAEEQWMRPGGIVVLERSRRHPEPSWPNEINPMKQRRYGEGCLWYGRRVQL